MLFHLQQDNYFYCVYILLFYIFSCVEQRKCRGRGMCRRTRVEIAYNCEYVKNEEYAKDEIFIGERSCRGDFILQTHN